MADAVNLARVHRPLPQQPAQAVGQLDLARAIAGRGLERGEDVGRQDVAADDRQVRRRLFASRLLDEVRDAVHARPEVDALVDRDDAVARDVLVRHALDGEHRAVDPLVDVDHLPQRRRRRVDHVVAEDDGERLVADQILRDQHRVAEAERLALPDVGHLDRFA